MTHRTINTFTLILAILTGAALVCALEWWVEIESVATEIIREVLG